MREKINLKLEARKVSLQFKKENKIPLTKLDHNKQNKTVPQRTAQLSPHSKGREMKILQAVKTTNREVIVESMVSEKFRLQTTRLLHGLLLG